MFKKLILSIVLFLSVASVLNADVLSCDSEFVLGQDTYTYTGINMVNSSGAYSPRGACIDSMNNRAFMADTGNHRILVWNDLNGLTSGKGADAVLGQPDFGSTAANFGGRGAKTLDTPQGITVDASGNLWVADYWNNRVLRFNAPFSNYQSATLVLGQAGFSTGGPALTQAGFENPADVAFDPNGNLLVADSNNGRVLRFSSPFSSNMDADLVLGSTDYIVNRGLINRGKPG